MAQKLTEQEHDAIVDLAKLLGKELPSKQRSVAGGIASGLVRLRRNPVPVADAQAVLAKYGAGQETLDALVGLGVLEPAADGAGYLLRVSPAREGQGDAAAGSDAADGGKPDGRHAEDADADAAAKRTAADAARPAPSPARPGRGSRRPAADAPAKPDRPAAADAAKPAAPAPLARREARTLAHLNCVRKQTPELDQIRRKIIDLDPRLWINGWLLSTPEAYVRFERELRGLDAALSGSPALGDGTLSLRELSYRVFGDEKFLAPESDGRKLLHLMGLTDVVRTRPQVRLELLHHIPKHHRHLRLVVSENLDPWVNMRNAMFLDGRKRILDERVHGVVFGNGYLVDDPRKLPDLIETLGVEDVTVLYWGDLDRAGLSILARLREMADGRFDVQPFAAAYRLMLRRAMKRFPDPLDNEPTDQGGVTMSGLDLLEPCLKPRELDYLRVVLENALLIPQEIVTAEDL